MFATLKPEDLEKLEVRRDKKREEQLKRKELKIQRKQAQIEKRRLKRKRRLEKQKQRQEERALEKKKRQEEWEAKKPERVRKRRKFFKGLRNVGLGLMCAGKQTIIEMAKSPKVLADFRSLAATTSETVASGGATAVLEGAMIAKTMVDVTKLVSSIGDEIVNNCIRDPEAKQAAKDLVTVADTAKYTMLATKEGPMAAMAAIVEDTKKKAISEGAAVVENTGVPSEVMAVQRQLLNAMEERGIIIPPDFIEWDAAAKLSYLRRVVPTPMEIGNSMPPTPVPTRPSSPMRDSRPVSPAPVPTPPPSQNSSTSQPQSLPSRSTPQVGDASIPQGASGVDELKETMDDYVRNTDPVNKL